MRSSAWDKFYVLMRILDLGSALEKMGLKPGHIFLQQKNFQIILLPFFRYIDA